MGTLASNPTAAAALDGQIVKKGLNLALSVITRELGTEVAGPNATIRAGQMVSRDASGYVIPANLTDVYGVAKWGKEAYGVSVLVDVPIILNGTTATFVGRANISNETVRSAPGMAGTVYAGAGGDYNVVAAAGTIARDATTTIPDGATVYVTATYALIEADFQFDGRFFQNQNADRTAYQDGRITVITDWARLFTTEWTTGDGLANAANSTYSLTGANSRLFCSAEGKFTNDSTIGGDFVGKVYQIPTAQDPYMGVTFGGNPV